MTTNLHELINRDLAALEADLDRLRERIDAVRAAVKSGDTNVVPSRASYAEETARVIRDRLHEIGLQVGQGRAR
ncbi:hypothetical protein ACXIUS_01625 [Bosea thiooxidans]